MINVNSFGIAILLKDISCSYSFIPRAGNQYGFLSAKLQMRDWTSMHVNHINQLTCSIRENVYLIRVETASKNNLTFFLHGKRKYLILDFWLHFSKHNIFVQVIGSDYSIERRSDQYIVFYKLNSSNFAFSV